MTTPATLAGEPAKGAEKRPLHKRKYRPLDVKTWYEGSLRLIGWILVICLAVLTGGLWVSYELFVLNKHDTDFRDLYFDQRLTNSVNNVGHKNFLLAEFCCNRDPVHFPYQCDEEFPDQYSLSAPFCKPLIMLECTDIRGAACNATRQVLYSAVGLGIVNERVVYENCTAGGRVRVGATAVAVGRPITLVAYYRSIPTGDTLVIQSPFNINTTEVFQFVDQVAASVPAAEVDYVQPSARLSNTLSLASTSATAVLVEYHDGGRRLRAPPPWKAVSNLWPWPGMNARCPNTGVSNAYYILGEALVVIPRFALSRPQDTLLTLAAGNDTLEVPGWQVVAVDADNQTVGVSTEVEVSFLTSVQVSLGQVSLLGACDGWRFSLQAEDVDLTYTPYWTGPIAELKAGITFGPFVQAVSLKVLDVNGPRYFELPYYGGMWYIWNAFFMAFIWLVSNSLMLFIIILVWWNIRSNKGLPPIIYRYMQKYRGW
ncbi:hypothetical protein HYH02_011840 [Chlamydomonas schloesseri]|uniref:Transmembrane protein n=1 Tax=Chlamydomonas schloesseri TaxID=2026947 RepID=A0A835TC93_9CHLO|nr:hypothetical protein HYH02_011840 [Chlamydomonas schloesseri]|eukprot:KAG2435546.1 hypothetical protein HYH02_011840 [Chlamydomonas schloesseri]